MLSKEWGLLLGVSQTLYPPLHPKKKRKKGKQIIITQTHRERCINNGGQGDIFQRSNERPIRGLPWPFSSLSNFNQSKALCGRRHFLVFQLLVSYVLLTHFPYRSNPISLSFSLPRQICRIYFIVPCQTCLHQMIWKAGSSHWNFSSFFSSTQVAYLKIPKRYGDNKFTN